MHEKKDIEITDEMIRTIFLNGLDFSKFTNENTEEILNHFKTIIITWEKNKHKVTNESM